jgi:hypothetical protein
LADDASKTNTANAAAAASAPAAWYEE